MSKFHLMHCAMYRRMHGTHGYKEVIDSVEWGLRALGHEVSQALNQFDPSATNIVFGAQVLPMDMLRQLQQLAQPTIVYNFEQLRGIAPELVREEIRFCANHFRIWDYSPANLGSWAALCRGDVQCVPVGYAPVLTRIPKAAEQDIDVLIYGSSGLPRLQAFHSIAEAGLATSFVCGMYGQLRDEMIARAKIVLNINLYEHARIFEIVRVSYLFANRKAVMADLHPQTEIDADVLPALRVTTLPAIVDSCLDLLMNDDKRLALEETGHACIVKRDVRPILQAALDGAC